MLKYNDGDVVFFLTDRESPNVGIIEHYSGHGRYCIKIYAVKERRTINGINIKDFDFKQEYKLPKKYSWNMALFELGYEDIPHFDIHNIDDVKAAIKNGYLVPLDETIQGYPSAEVGKNTYKIRIVWQDYKSSLELVHEEHIFHNMQELTNYVKELRKKREEIRERHSKMTEAEICMEEIEERLKRICLNDNDYNRCIQAIKETDGLPEIEELEIRFFDDFMQWYDDSCKQWKNLVKIERPKIKEPTARYYISVIETADKEETQIAGYFVDDFTEDYEKYKDPLKYRLCIADKTWTFENSLEVPINYSTLLGGKLLVNYKTKHGYFSVVDGELYLFDLSIDRKYSVNNFDGIWVYGGTTRSETEIFDHVVKKLKDITGEFHPLFVDALKKITFS